MYTEGDGVGTCQQCMCAENGIDVALRQVRPSAPCHLIGGARHQACRVSAQAGRGGPCMREHNHQLMAHVARHQRALGGGGGGDDASPGINQWHNAKSSRRPARRAS